MVKFIITSLLKLSKNGLKKKNHNCNRQYEKRMQANIMAAKKHSKSTKCLHQISIFNLDQEKLDTSKLKGKSNSNLGNPKIEIINKPG